MMTMILRNNNVISACYLLPRQAKELQQCIGNPIAVFERALTFLSSLFNRHVENLHFSLFSFLSGMTWNGVDNIHIGLHVQVRLHSRSLQGSCWGQGRSPRCRWPQDCCLWQVRIVYFPSVLSYDPNSTQKYYAQTRNFPLRKGAAVSAASMFLLSNMLHAHCTMSPPSRHARCKTTIY